MRKEDHYCVCYDKLEPCYRGHMTDCKTCGCFQLKWPTPAQYKMQEGHEWAPENAIYMLERGSKLWKVRPYFRAQNGEALAVVCASTEFGAPPQGWMPRDI